MSRIRQHWLSLSLLLSLSLSPLAAFIYKKKHRASFAAWKILNVHRDIAIKWFCSIKNFPRTESNYYCYMWQAIHLHNSHVHICTSNNFCILEITRKFDLDFWRFFSSQSTLRLFLDGIIIRNQSRYNRWSRRTVPYARTLRAKQTGRFILNDMKKRLGDLCAQIVLSLCRCSGSCCSSSLENRVRCSSFADILLGTFPLSPISSVLNRTFSRFTVR